MLRAALLCFAVLCCALLWTGEPMRYAKAALLTGLLKLDASDRFGLVAFDHDQNWWTGATGRLPLPSSLLSAGPMEICSNS
jgi:hypothetical protein